MEGAGIASLVRLGVRVLNTVFVNFVGSIASQLRFDKRETLGEEIIVVCTVFFSRVHDVAFVQVEVGLLRVGATTVRMMGRIIFFATSLTISSLIILRLLLSLATILTLLVFREALLS